jgi:hypothetical protein
MGANGIIPEAHENWERSRNGPVTTFVLSMNRMTNRYQPVEHRRADGIGRDFDQVNRWKEGNPLKKLEKANEGGFRD